MKKSFALLAITVAVSACSSTPPADPAVSQAPQTPPGAATESTPAAAATASTAPAASTSTSGVNVPADGALTAKRSVYFDYDSTSVKDEYRPVISAHAKNLAQDRARHVTVEGNTDERGSREYNLALGQRRAEAVKQGLTLMGVPATQIETVSFGEEKPRDAGENEAAFAENRRADIVYR